MLVMMTPYTSLVVKDGDARTEDISLHQLELFIAVDPSLALETRADQRLSQERIGLLNPD
jgi:hypothetical protein